MLDTAEAMLGLTYANFLFLCFVKHNILFNIWCVSIKHIGNITSAGGHTTPFNGCIIPVSVATALFHKPDI